MRMDGISSSITEFNTPRYRTDGSFTGSNQGGGARDSVKSGELRQVYHPLNRKSQDVVDEVQVVRFSRIGNLCPNTCLLVMPNRYNRRHQLGESHRGGEVPGGNCSRFGRHAPQQHHKPSRILLSLHEIRLVLPWRDYFNTGKELSTSNSALYCVRKQFSPLAHHPQMICTCFTSKSSSTSSD